MTQPTGADPGTEAAASRRDRAHDLVTAERTPRAGLSSGEAEHRRRQGLGNAHPPASGRSTWQIIRANVFTRINAILATLLVIVLLTGSWNNAAFGMLIIFNSGIGIIQEIRAKRMLDRLAVVGESRPRIRRSDQPTTEHPASDLVAGDLVEVGRGDQMVVDGVLVEGRAIEVDEALLTGESDPVVKQVGDPVWSGSFIVAGSGCYQAVKVGADSYASQLTAEASKFSLTHSVLMQGINQILRVITWLLVPVAVLTIVNGLRQAEDERGWRGAVLDMAGALVPMIPEGLVLLTSMAFMVGVVRLGRRQCLVQELPAIEGLARVDVVCADKTGTLTENGLRLVEVLEVEPEPDADPAPGTDAGPEPELADVLVTLASADASQNPSMDAIREQFPDQAPQTIAATIAFTSARKFSAVQLGEPASGPWWFIGAPDVLATGAVAARAEDVGSQGLRVLLLGRWVGSQPPSPDAISPADIAPTALVVLEQRVRPDAAETIDYFEQQGVQVKVISGDNAVSVGAVAAAVGIGAGEPVDARTLPAPGSDLDQIATHSHVFGRVSPEQKRHLVGAMQGQGHAVAMTGDGVNDVLALKDADIGVAMGSGSAAARGVAQIVLLDNKFATLPHVVAEGRRVIGNIERVANLFLTKTVYSVGLALLVGLASLTGLAPERFPFQPIHVTMTGWFTIGIPAAVLALAPNRDRARPGFVSRVLRLALPAGIVVALCTAISWWVAMPNHGAPDQAWTQASTAALVTQLTVASWVLAVVARPWRAWKIALLLASMGSYVLIFSLPVLHRVLLLDTSDRPGLLVGLLIGVAGAVLVEAIWWVNRARTRARESSVHGADPAPSP